MINGRTFVDAYPLRVPGRAWLIGAISLVTLGLVLFIGSLLWPGIPTLDGGSLWDPLAWYAFLVGWMSLVLGAVVSWTLATPQPTPGHRTRLPPVPAATRRRAPAQL